MTIPDWLWQGLSTNFIAVIVTFLASSLLWWFRYRRIIPKVAIKVWNMSKQHKAQPDPETLIIIYSGMSADLRNATTEAEQERKTREFHAMIDRSDYEGLGISETTQGLGHTVRAISHYKSLLRVVLITTTESYRCVPVLRAFLKEKAGTTCSIEASPDDTIDLTDDREVTEAAYVTAKTILERLHGERVARSRTLVDVTGGVRSMQVGVLLACLGREQDIHLIGTAYDEAGRPKPGTAFPLVIHFEPRFFPESNG